MPRRRAGRAVGRRTLFKAAAAAIGALALSALAISVTVAMIPPLYRLASSRAPSVAFAQANAALASQGQVSADTLKMVAEGARRAPLAAEPFFFKALADPAQGARSVRLLEEARKRDPRYRAARLMLFERYVQTDNLRGATEEMIVLTRLLPDANSLLTDELAKLAADPRTALATRRALGSEPILDVVLAQMLRNGVAPDTVLNFAGSHRPGASAAAANANWQYLMVDALIRRNDVNRAYELWRRFYGIKTRSFIYNPEFRDLPGSPPFNWHYAADEVGSAEQHNGTLEVTYFGRRSGDLVKQLLMLPAGRYRLSFRIEGNANGRGSRLIWRLMCNGATAPLIEMPLEGINYSSRLVQTGFAVPSESCDGQWLQLSGESTEFPTTQSADIKTLSIQPETSK